MRMQNSLGMSFARGSAITEPLPRTLLTQRWTYISACFGNEAQCIGVSLTTPQSYTQYYTPYYTQYYNTNPPHRRTRKEAKQTPSHMQPTHILADVRSSRSSHTNQSHDIHPLLLNTASLSALAFLFILSTLPWRNLNQHAAPSLTHSLVWMYFSLYFLFALSQC